MRERGLKVLAGVLPGGGDDDGEDDEDEVAAPSQKRAEAVKPVPAAKSIPTPEEIVAELDRHVIGQDEAKRALAVAIRKHYLRIASPANGAKPDVQIKKDNVLLNGPTGSGKTLLVETLAKILDVPLAISDATSLTEAGYVGDDVEDIVLHLLQAADYDVAKAQRGIIYIDEIDKINAVQGSGRDVSGEGVQKGLLKIVEGKVVGLPEKGKTKGNSVKVDTSNILFIAGGAFVGLLEQVKQRLLGERSGDGSKIGFGAPIDRPADITDQEAVRELEAADMKSSGMIPEFVGRFPVLTSTVALDRATLADILQKPKDSLFRQYQAMLKMEGVELEFAPGTAEALAEKALRFKTGARALQGVMESLMRDVMFRLPSRKGEIQHLVITPEIAAKKAPTLAEILEATEKAENTGKNTK